MTAEPPLLTTPLHALHLQLGAKMAGFAGYEMPIHYQDGIMAEHLATRSAATLFDVSHMGQCIVTGPKAAALLERVVVGDIQDLRLGGLRYTLLMNEAGGIVDDLMILRRAEHSFFMVVNAGRKDVDFAIFAALFAGQADFEILTDQALIALQGPDSARILGRLIPALDTFPFMTGGSISLSGVEMTLTRSGYTGEDGFEISLPAAMAETFAKRLSPATWAGLGARDSLRLEAGLPLYGHELGEEISPVEAALSWTIGKRRRQNGDFLGAARVLQELQMGPARKRVGIKPAGRMIARDGVEIFDVTGNQKIGEITSGGYGASVGSGVAMGLVTTAFSQPETPVQLKIRGANHPATLVPLPFIPHTYKR